MFNFLFAIIATFAPVDNGCYIVCETIDTIGWEERTFISDNGIEHRTEPILAFRETFRIQIDCNSANAIDEQRLRVIR